MRISIGIVFVAGLLISTIATVDESKDESGKGRVEQQWKLDELHGYHRNDGSYF